MGTSGIIKAKLGYYGNFILGICMITICLIYAIFFLKVGTWCMVQFSPNFKYYRIQEH